MMWATETYNYRRTESDGRFDRSVAAQGYFAPEQKASPPARQVRSISVRGNVEGKCQVSAQERHSEQRRRLWRCET